MTTVRQIITDAYREGGLIASGEVPDAAQFDEGLRKLENLFTSFFGVELGQRLLSLRHGYNPNSNIYGQNVDAPHLLSSSFVPAGVRLLVSASNPETLYLDPSPQDGARLGVIDTGGNLSGAPITLQGNGRLINGQESLILNQDGMNTEWFYREDLASWQPVSGLMPNFESPLPSKFDELLSTLLYLRLTTRFGTNVSTEIATYMRRMVKLFKAQYSQVTFVPSEAALTRLSSDRRIGRFYSYSPYGFDYGITSW